jgi:hypothetical protein
MYIGIALLSVVLVLLCVLVIYSRHMDTVQRHYVQSRGQPKSQPVVTEGVESQAAGQPEARGSKEFHLQSVEEPTKRKYDIRPEVLVSYAKTCPINRPVPLVVAFFPPSDELRDYVKAKAQRLMPSGTKPGTIEQPLGFEASESNPKIKVELSFPEGTLKADTKSIVKRLEPYKVTEFEFLVTAMLGTNLTTLVRVKYMKTEKEEIELLVIHVPINAKALWKLDNQQLSVVKWVVGVGILVAATSLAVVFPDSRPTTPILGALGVIATPLLGSVDFTKFTKKS